MSWQAAAFVKRLTENLTCPEKLVLLILADYCNPESGVAWPSVAILSKQSLMTERNTFRMLSSLERKGFISRQARRGKVTEYRINIASDVTPDNMSPLTPAVPTPDKTPDNTGISGGSILMEPKRVEPKEPTNSASSKIGRRNGSIPDPRFKEVVDLIFRAYKHFNEGVDCPWGKADGKALKDLLEAVPKADVFVIHGWLKNYFRSEINKADRPVYWLHKLPGYAGGPLDRFRKPLAPDTTEGYVHDLTRQP